MRIGAILMMDAIAEVGRLKAELEQTKTAAKMFESLWHKAEDELMKLRRDYETLRGVKLLAEDPE